MLEKVSGAERRKLEKAILTGKITLRVEPSSIAPTSSTPSPSARAPHRELRLRRAGDAPMKGVQHRRPSGRRLRFGRASRLPVVGLSGVVVIGRRRLPLPNHVFLTRGAFESPNRRIGLSVRKSARTQHGH
jgi:hypothetical protein